jgi:hypothetical protein
VRVVAAKAGIPIAAHSWSGRPLRLPVSVAGLSACLLLGCAVEHSHQVGSTRSSKTAIPLPERALLKPQGEPGCEFKTSRLDGGEGRGQSSEPVPTRVANLAGREQSARSDGQPPTSAPLSQQNRKLGQIDPNAALGLRIRLEYERDCFRRAEMQGNRVPATTAFPD